MLSIPTIDVSQSKKDIQECMREVQRVFKSIVQGPDSKVDDETQTDGQKIFDDLHVIICMNNLL